jgi:hypothetical protein
VRRAALLALIAAGCTSTSHTPLDDASWPATKGEGVSVHARPGDVDGHAAQLVAKDLTAVRASVGEALGLVGSGSGAPPLGEVLLYRDTGWGQERWLETHATILEHPLRVRIPCALPEADAAGDQIAAWIRGTVAHEVAEASVLTRVPILDPYLRWFHDGVAECVAYRVLTRLDAKAADEMLARYEQYVREARRSRKAIAWVDLTRWRQLPNWVVHSDVIFPKEGPLSLDNVPRSLDRVAEKRVAAARDPETVAVLDDLVDMLGLALVKEQLPLADGEADVHTPSGQFLCYGASFCFWLELERAHPGITAGTLAQVERRHRAVLRSDDVVTILGQLAGEDVRVRLERFTLDHLEAILGDERRGDERRGGR